MEQGQNNYQNNLGNMHEQCEKCISYHITITMKDGNTFDGIIERVGTDHVDMLVGEDVMDGEEGFQMSNQMGGQMGTQMGGQMGNQMGGQMQRQWHPRRRFRRFRRRRFPLAALAALSLINYPYIAPPYPYYPYYPY